MDMTVEAYVAKWHDEKWPDKDDRIVGTKLAEEAGEVCGALIKIAEGRKTQQDMFDEMGDVLIVLSTLAGRHGTTLETLRADRLATVINRPDPDVSPYAWLRADPPLQADYVEFE